MVHWKATDRNMAPCACAKYGRKRQQMTAKGWLTNEEGCSPGGRINQYLHRGRITSGIVKVGKVTGIIVNTHPDEFIVTA
jgi:hypothetical protein